MCMVRRKKARMEKGIQRSSNRKEKVGPRKFLTTESRLRGRGGRKEILQLGKKPQITLRKTQDLPKGKQKALQRATVAYLIKLLLSCQKSRGERAKKERKKRPRLECSGSCGKASTVKYVETTTRNAQRPVRKKRSGRTCKTRTFPAEKRPKQYNRGPEILQPTRRLSTTHMKERKDLELFWAYVNEERSEGTRH